MNSIISVQELSKIYKLYDSPSDRVKEALHPFRKIYSKEFYALDNISFDVAKGETFGIVGKNGSGKSTLLKILTGVLNPTKGKVLVNGRIAALLELGAGFNPEMTGLENIYLNGTIMGCTKKEIDSKVNEILSFADIGGFIYQPVKMYSSGMFARLAFSVAVNVDPDILIVDEALSVGDIFFQQKCMHKMKTMQQSGVTIFFVSHALGTVKALCEKVIYLKQGQLIAIGDPERVCSLYQNELTAYSEKDKKEAIEASKVELNIEENLHFLSVEKSEVNWFREDSKLSNIITERSGKGEIRLTAFDIYDGNNKQTNHIATSQPFIIRASYRVMQDIPAGASLGVLCRNETGIDIFACNSNIYSIYLPAMKAGEKFVYEIELSAPLLSGRFWFHIGAKPNASSMYFYDRCFSVNYLEVFNSPELVDKNIGGLIYIKPKNIRIVCQ
jgi:ABC-type polysaccharide/polyol phosphate transport system ATPase subunit